MLTAHMRELEGDYVLADNMWDELVWVWRRTEAPKACKVEIVEGLITVAPSPRSRTTWPPNAYSDASTT